MEFQRPLCIFLVLFTLLSSSQAHKFYVGGSDGWVPNPSESYNQWAGRNRFQVNDTLVFKYKKGSDSLLEVKKEDYDKCNKTNPIKKFEDGDTEFKFDRTGPFYFISGKDGNCEKGQKLIVVVLSLRGGGQTQTPPPSPSVPSPTPSPPSPLPSPVSNPPVAHPPGGGGGGVPTISPSPKLSPPSGSPPAPSPSSNAPSPSISPSPARIPPSTSPSPAGSPGPASGPPAPSPATPPGPASGPPAPSPATPPGPASGPPAPSPATPPVPASGPPAPSPSGPATSPPPSTVPPSSRSNSPASPPPGNGKSSAWTATPSSILVYSVIIVVGIALLR